MMVLIAIAAVFFGVPVAVAAVVMFGKAWLLGLDPLIRKYRHWRFRRYCRRTMSRQDAEAFIRENCP